ncbi:hypothetical protein [Haliea sp.]|uniref:hypothetical protein n=1 Tax=Haliea sp. TaxID=1932666 RepID=UPI00257AB656|nr:hypothetical protein [Haliea sp.]
MRVSQLKTLIKETVREVFQEEIKGLLMEALTSKTLPAPPPPIQEAVAPPPPPPQMRDSFRQQYAQMMNGEMNFNTQNTPTQPAYRPVSPQMTMGENASLPPGEVNLDQIAGIMTPKK